MWAHEQKVTCCVVTCVAPSYTRRSPDLISLLLVLNVEERLNTPVEAVSLV